jgi:hypothetical protein
MLRYQQAEELAGHWVRIISGGKCQLVPDATLTKPYGWVFFYETKAFLEDPSNFEAAALGNAPITVDRIDGEIRVTGTAPPLETHIARYESTLPAARLLMSPEYPSRKE